MVKLEKLQWSVFSGSGSFWASRIQIRILSSTSIILLKTLDFYSFGTSYDLLSMKTDVNVPTIGTGNQQKKKLKERNYFLLASSEPLKKRPGSGPLIKR
jgi:hypothetical protein